MNEIDTKGGVRIVDELYEMGAKWFGLSGGEPLLREDLIEIVKSVDDRSTAFMFTSGYGLTEEKAKELKKAGLFGVMISLVRVSRPPMEGI